MTRSWLGFQSPPVLTFPESCVEAGEHYTLNLQKSRVCASINNIYHLKGPEIRDGDVLQTCFISNPHTLQNMFYYLHFTNVEAETYQDNWFQVLVNVTTLYCTILVPH